MTDYDTTEKLERTDRGYRLTVESTRGTGTRDQDKVKCELRTESIPDQEEIQAVLFDVKDSMQELRKHQPDEESDNE